MNSSFHASFDEPPRPNVSHPELRPTVLRRTGDVTMRAQIGAGPATPYASKPLAGFTGRHALRYSGAQNSPGAAEIALHLFDVHITIGEHTELSYLIFPERDPDGDYPSTHIAVDLAFADGGHLSDTDAVDQLGFGASPLAQGQGKSLYANQWNKRTIALDALAGREITGILLAYHYQNGPAEFDGWLDEITIENRQPEHSQGQHSRPCEWVLTTRGTHSANVFSRGNNIPATAMPHGFNFWTPVTNASTLRRLYEYHRANDAANKPRLQAFSLSHQPSPWMGDRHTFQVLPSLAAHPQTTKSARALAFDHADEIANPHRYAVTFANGIRVELAPTEHAAIFRFSFPGKKSSLVFSNVRGANAITIDAEAGVLTGYTDVRSRLSVGAGRMYLYATLDQPIRAAGFLRRGVRRTRTGFARFDTEVVHMRIATSLISVEQARRNLELELAADDTVESVAERAADAWDALLGRIEVDGATDDQLATLYGNLYRLFLYPNAGHENVGSKQDPVYRHASPATGSIVDGQVYVNNGFWDTYRTVWPAYALLAPTKCGELIDGFLNIYRQGGWLPRWSSPGYADLMTGTSSDVAFADAYLKGVRFDVRTAYEAALRNATVTPDNPSVGRKGLARSIFRRFTSTATQHGLCWTLEGCLNDFGIGNLAAALGDHDAATYFADRARDYLHSFEPSTGFFLGRKENGGWRIDPAHFDPRVWGHDYTETNAWNTAFSVPHDGEGLAVLHGGRDKLAAKLDQFFATPETGQLPGQYSTETHEVLEATALRMGQYGHSNQPSHHIAYMYAYAGTPWRTQKIVREVLARCYSGSEIGQGYPGDEDNGEMSAWWLFSALGFYPLAVGRPYYAIGSPAFRRAVVHLENGRDLVINASNNSTHNVYVRSLRVNGKPWHDTYLPHDVLAAGAVLDFDMGPTPSRWGADRPPPSLTPAGETPDTRTDVTAVARAESSAAQGISALFDDTTATECTFDGASGWVRWTLPEPALVTVYTITSGGDIRAGDPSAWTLSASGDGHTWTVLDERADERFRWRRQTRPFAVASPGRYRHYRLEFTANSGAPTTAIAQLELLGGESFAERGPISGER